MSIFIIIYTIIIVTTTIKSKKKRYNPIWWLIISWGFLFINYYCSGIEYLPISMELILFIILCIFSFSFSFFLGYNKKKQVAISKSTNLTMAEDKVDTIKYFWLSLIGCIVYLIDVFRLNGLNIIRGAKQISTVGSIAALLYPLALFVLIYEIIFSIKNEKSMPLYTYICIFVYLCPVILIGGRLDFMILVLCVVIAILQERGRKEIKERKKNKKISRLIVGFGAVATIANYAIEVGSKRFSNSQIMIGTFEYALNCVITDTTIKFASYFGVFSDLIINLLAYYSHQLAVLQVLFSEYNGPYLFGLYELPYLARRIPSILIPEYTEVVNVQRRIFTSVGAPSFSSAWRTMLGYTIIDFGTVGTVMILFVLGLLVGRLTTKYRFNPTTINATKFAFICTMIVFTIQYSPFFEPAIIYAFYWSLLISFIEKRVKFKV